MSAAVLVGGAPTVARAEPGDRVVHGTVAVPTASRVAVGPERVTVLPQTFGPVTLDPVGPVQVAGAHVHPQCLADDAVEGTAFLIENVKAGRTFELTADAGSWNDDFDIAFYGSRPSPCDGVDASDSLRYKNHAGDERSVVPEGAGFALVTLVTGRPGAAFTYRELAKLHVKFTPVARRKPTVVAVLEPHTSLLEGANGYSPYHFDFLGHQHPWNTDDDLENDFDFDADPKDWLPGYPGATPVELTLPKDTEGDARVSERAGTRDGSGKLTGGDDSEAWNSMQGSNATTTNLYRFPGTKVVGAVSFGTTDTPARSIYADNNAHGTKSASVAAGNTHGTCPECVFVLVLFIDPDIAVRWVAEQPWIDVVTNSWGRTGNVSLPSRFPYDVTRPAVERGQTWVWASGNGAGTMEAGVPNQTYSWGLHAADWNVLVGGVADEHERSKHSGRSVDLASHMGGYPSSGGATAAGTGTHTGTSTAAPVVAGTFAKLTQWGRDLLDDRTPGHHRREVAGRLEGVLAEGEPRPCEGPVSGCVLDDGILTRAEVEATVFGNVLPSAVRPPSTQLFPVKDGQTQHAVHTPSVLAYTHQGHGVVNGRIDESTFVAEQRRFLDALRGAVVPFTRPPGEANWMFADSKCRQRLWGEWTGGYYREGDPDPAWDGSTDQPAMAWNAACTPLPNGALRDRHTTVLPFCIRGSPSFCVPAL